MVAIPHAPDYNSNYRPTIRSRLYRNGNLFACKDEAYLPYIYSSIQNVFIYLHKLFKAKVCLDDLVQYTMGRQNQFQQDRS